MNATQDHTISRRKQKKNAEKLKRAQTSGARAHAAATLRNSRARRFHQTLSRPGRGGLSAKGAAQLQQFFSKKVPDSEKPSLRDLDPTASITLSHLLREEVGVQDGLYEELARATGLNMMVSGEGEGGDEKMLTEQEGEVGEAEMEVGEVEMEVEEGELGEVDYEQGGVALANDLRPCIEGARNEQGGVALASDL